MASTARPLPSSPPRRSALPLTSEHLATATAHLRSDTRARWRRESRVIVARALVEARATVADVAEALSIDDRGAGRALQGERPVDVGDVLALAASGPGGARAARRVLTALRDEVDEIERCATGTHGR